MGHTTTPSTPEVHVFDNSDITAHANCNGISHLATLHASGRLSSAAAAVFAVLDESRGAQVGIELRVPSPTREQWVEVFGEAGENPHLPRTVWCDELQDEESEEQDYWTWVVGSYPPVWGLNCDGIAREPIGRPLPAGLCRGRPAGIRR